MWLCDSATGPSQLETDRAAPSLKNTWREDVRVIHTRQMKILQEPWSESHPIISPQQLRLWIQCDAIWLNEILCDSMWLQVIVMLYKCDSMRYVRRLVCALKQCSLIVKVQRGEVVEEEEQRVSKRGPQMWSMYLRGALTCDFIPDDEHMSQPCHFRSPWFLQSLMQNARKCWRCHYSHTHKHTHTLGRRAHRLAPPSFKAPWIGLEVSFTAEDGGSSSAERETKEERSEKKSTRLLREAVQLKDWKWKTKSAD